MPVRIVWCTKFRFHILEGDFRLRCRSLLIQICDAENVQIFKGALSRDHVQMHHEYQPTLSVGNREKIQESEIKISSGVSRFEETLLA